MQAGTASGGRPPITFFRNDDVNELTPELIAVSERLWSLDVPVIHAVEPGNLTDECASWLNERKAEHGRLLEITQHGYNHVRHDRGEFGGKRSSREQYEDLERGMRIMDDRFGDRWFRCISFPYEHYNRGTLRAIEDLGYLVISCRRDTDFSAAMLQHLGRMTKRGQIGSRHVSHHLAIHPGTNTFAVDWAIDFTENHGDTSGEIRTLSRLMNRYEKTSSRQDVFGWRLHHRYLRSEANLDLLCEVVEELRNRRPEIEFRTYKEIFAAFGPRKLSLATR